MKLLLLFEIGNASFNHGLLLLNVKILYKNEKAVGEELRISEINFTLLTVKYPQLF